jgi:hypothetical protein
MDRENKKAKRTEMKNVKTQTKEERAGSSSRTVSKKVGMIIKKNNGVTVIVPFKGKRVRGD